MDFKRGAPKRRLTRRNVEDESDMNSLALKYPFALQFFKYPPMEDAISLQEFEHFAVDRLKVLRIIEKAKLKYIKNSELYRDTIFAEMKKESLNSFFKKTPLDEKDAKLIDYQDRRMDHISHFILRLAYCKTEELRRWFLRCEADFFAFRFYNEHREVIKRWLKHNELHFEMISPEDKGRLHDILIAKRNSFISENTDFFKVPFTDVLELVEKRRAYLEKGFAYIKIKDLSVIVSSQYRAHLSQALVLTARAMPNIEDDTRLAPLLNCMHVRYVGSDFSTSKTDGRSISRHELNALSEKSFPLCMRQVHTALRQNHHLKHYGRLQYILFLKGIGLTLEEVLQFWREEFTKIMDMDKFEKQYAYNIRHSFGKEGKRTSYTPYSCMKIIMSNQPSTGDYHGCPFRHADAALLKQRLYGFKVSPMNVQEVIFSVLNSLSFKLPCKQRKQNIMDMVSHGHFQLACARFFEATHNTELKQSLNHPNQYFEESYRLSHPSATTEAAAQKIASRPMVSQVSTTSQSSPSQSSGSQSAAAAVGNIPLDDDVDTDGIMASME